MVKTKLSASLGNPAREYGDAEGELNPEVATAGGVEPGMNPCEEAESAAGRRVPGRVVTCTESSRWRMRGRGWDDDDDGDRRGADRADEHLQQERGDGLGLNHLGERDVPEVDGVRGRRGDHGELPTM